MDAYKTAIIKLASEQSTITAIDVGCARCSFLNEFLINYFSRENIKILGIDPLKHNGNFDASAYYDFYVKGCVDNIPRNTTRVQEFYVNEIDQASSLLKIKPENFTSDINNSDNGFYYPEDIINRLKNIVGVIAVNVYNINDIIALTLGDSEIIDFIKIDAEGKDVDIVKSLKENLHRIRYIGVECSSHKNEQLEIFENGSRLSDAVDFFKENGFEVFELTDYSTKSDNLTQMSDVVFVNNMLK
jgi:Methyltransferase FkbM domain